MVPPDTLSSKTSPITGDPLWLRPERPLQTEYAHLLASGGSSRIIMPFGHEALSAALVVRHSRWCRSVAESRVTAALDTPTVLTAWAS